MFAQVGWPGFWMFAIIVVLLLMLLTHFPDSWWPDWYVGERTTVLSCTGGTLVTSAPKPEGNKDTISLTIYLEAERIYIDVPGK
jgi:hypothetical protein